MSVPKSRGSLDCEEALAPTPSSVCDDVETSGYLRSSYVVPFYKQGKRWRGVSAYDIIMTSDHLSNVIGRVFVVIIRNGIFVF